MKNFFSELNPVYVGFTMKNSFKFKEVASACCALSLSDKLEGFCSKNIGQKTQHTHILPLEDLTFLCKGIINTTREYSEAVLHFA